MIKLAEKACLGLIENGEFGPETIAAARAVAVVLTQSWCPQWKWMQSYISTLPSDESTEIFWVEYDLETFFQPLMEFKEEVLGNDQVPYVRYYRDGKLSAQSNFVDAGAFLRYLRG